MPKKEPLYVISYTVERVPVGEKWYLTNLLSWTSDFEKAMKQPYQTMKSKLEMVKEEKPQASISEAPRNENFG